jgi:hypothetical protein
MSISTDLLNYQGMHQDVNTNERKHDVFRNGLSDEIQFQLLNTDYEDFRRMFDKAIIIENKIKEWARIASGKYHSRDSLLEAT